jgi:molybdopterin-guanine dinucleotide biosynthesis protein A
MGLERQRVFIVTQDRRAPPPLSPPAKLLGAVLAGGASRRFGSDKAAALLAGRALIDHVIDRLAPQAGSLVVVGRDHPGIVSIADRPSGLGPLGGLAAALAYAASAGFDAVLTSGCDLPDLPRDLAARLAPGPAVARGQPLLGLWPVGLAAALAAHLAGSADRSLHGWVALTGARTVDCGPIRNINRPEDL